MFDIILIRPPNLNAGYSFLASTTPLSLMYLSASLKRNSINARIIDFEINKYSEESVLSYAGNSKIIGITAFTNNLIAASRIAKCIKNKHPEKLVIIGGVHVSALPEETLKEFTEFDIAAIGEADISLVNLCDKFLKKKLSAAEFIADTYNIPSGFMVRHKNGFFYKPAERIADIDSLPFPDRTDINTYSGTLLRGVSRTKLRKVTDLLTSRGCPFNCYFCAVDLVFKKNKGRKIYFRNLSFVEKEIKEIVNKYKCNHIWLADSSLNANPERAKEIVKILIKYDLTYNCQLNINGTDEELVRLLKKSGCRQISVGVESGSMEIRKKINKPSSISKIKEFFKLTKKIGLRTDASFIFGSHLDETIKDIYKTINLIFSLKPDSVAILVGTPLPGTKMFCDFKAARLLPEKIDWEEFTFMGDSKSWGTKYVSGERISKLQKSTLLKFYLQPYQIMKRIRGINSLSQIKAYLEALNNLILR